MKGLFCKKEYPYYDAYCKCPNCLPSPKGDGIRIKIPKGTSIEDFFKSKDRTCPNCGLSGIIERNVK